MRHRVAALITGKRSAWAVIVLGLVLIGLVMSLGAGERQATPTDSLPRGYDSTAAAELREQLPEQDGTQALVLFTADEGTIDKAELPELARAAGLREDATVVPSEDGTAAITFVPIETTDSPKIRDAVRDLRADLGERTPDGITAEVTGPAGITADLAAVFDGADTRLLLSTASIVAVLLILTYRSPVLWIIPLTVIGVG
ncbi:MMPL family transporter, partial [Janibacter melonis]